MGDLSVGPVASIEKECVAFVLGAVVDFANGQEEGRDSHYLSFALLMVAAEHVNDNEVVVAVAVNVAEIDAHRKAAGVTHREVGLGAEVAVAIVDPDAIGREQVVANVNVRCAVAVHVSEHRRQTPVVRR